MIVYDIRICKMFETSYMSINKYNSIIYIERLVYMFVYIFVYIHVYRYIYIY